MSELEFIQEQFQALVPYLRERYGERGSLEISGKRDANDVLTDADIETQRRLVEAIHERFPGDGIVAEESGLDHFDQNAPARCWVLDPIDGTQNFVRGLFPVFGISVAFAQDGRVQAAGVVFPVLGDIFLAERGNGTTWNGRPARVSDAADLASARVELDPGHPEHRLATSRRIHRILDEAGQLRCHGAAVAGLCAVAAGQTDAYVQGYLSPWDFAAGLLLVEEAGGRVTRMDGSPVELFAPTASFIASNGALHDTLLERLAPGDPA